MTTFKFKKWKFTPSKAFAQAIKFSGTALILWIAYLNIGPYAFAIQKIGVRVIDQALIQGFYQLWFFGKIFQAFGLVSHWLLGLLIWFIIQSLQLAPILLKHSRKYMRNVISDAQSGGVFQIRDNDPGVLKALKKAYNLLPLQGMRKARIGAKLAYGLDAAFCLIAYPPIPGGDILKLLFALTLGQWNLIDWTAVLLTLITMFCIEILVEGWFWVNETTRYMK